MKVKITKTTEPDSWYAESIGVEFIVIGGTEQDYKTLVDGNLFYIYKDDCEIIQEIDSCDCGGTGGKHHALCEHSPAQQKKAETILEEASRLVDGDRGTDYGHPSDNHQATADLFNIYIERRYGVDLKIDAKDVCIFNIVQKISREANAPKRDNLTDICGYARNIEMIEERLPTDEKL